MSIKKLPDLRWEFNINSKYKIIRLHMAYFIVIRGPAAIGKSTIAKKLASTLHGCHISFDDVMRENKLDIIEGDGISAENFVKANELVIPKAKEILENDRIVIFDGCFYREKQFEHLKENLPYRHFVFSLKASLEDCLSRNKTRKRRMTKKGILEVYQLVLRLELGIAIETSGRTAEEVVNEIMKLLPT